MGEVLSEYSIYMWWGWRLSVGELVENQSHLLPAAIRIIEADLAHQDPRLSLNNHSVYFAYSIVSDDRVWARSENGTGSDGAHLSIPLSCPIFFKPLKSDCEDKSGEAKLIRELAQRKDFAGLKVIVDDLLDDLAHFGKLELLSTYTAIYLNAFPLNAAGDLLDRGRGRIFLPTYYNVVVDVAQPLTNKILRTKLLSLMSRHSSSHIHHFKQEIVIFGNETEEDTYDSIPLSAYHKKSIDTSPPIPLTNITPPLPPRRLHLTENLQPASDVLNTPLTPRSSTQRPITSRVNIASSSGRYNPSSQTLPHFKKATTVAATNQRISAHDTRLSRPASAHNNNNPSSDNNCTPRKSTPAIATLIKRFKIFATTKNSLDDRVFLTARRDLVEDAVSGADDITKRKGEDINDEGDGTYDKIGSPVDKRLHHRSSSCSDVASLSPTSSSHCIASPLAAATSVVPPDRRPSHSDEALYSSISEDTHSDSILEIYESSSNEKQRSRHIFLPPASPKPLISDSNNQAHINRETSDGVATQWPADVSILSVGQVGECLRLLNLSAHVAAMGEEQVDGQLLQSLDVCLLASHFHLRRVDALKLVHFAQHHWRPKY